MCENLWTHPLESTCIYTWWGQTQKDSLSVSLWSLLPPVGVHGAFTALNWTGRNPVTGFNELLNKDVNDLFWSALLAFDTLCVWLSVCLQFSFSFVETHTVSAVRIRPRLLTAWPEEESEEEQEEGDSKTTPIILSEGAAFPWNMDGELVEIANEVLVRYDDHCGYCWKICPIIIRNINNVVSAKFKLCTWLSVLRSGSTRGSSLCMARR